MAADLCGKAERLKASYTITEAGQDARVSMLTGRPAAQSTVSREDVQPRARLRVPAEGLRRTAERAGIVLPYDGLNPQPPTYCYLKPHYLDVQTSYFDHVAKGAL